MLLSQWLSWELHGSHTRWNCETREAAALASGRLTESHSEEANVVGGSRGAVTSWGYLVELFFHSEAKPLSFSSLK